MCSWCWGYQPTLKRIELALHSNGITWRRVLGGLARDTEDPMPVEMQKAIEGYWRHIESLLGTEFNFDFWRNNTPRRSTYPACRAVLIARQYGLEKEMNTAIQEAYYLQAINPSDVEVLCSLANNLGIGEDFEYKLFSDEMHSALQEEIRFARSIGGSSFPSWIIIDRERRCFNLDIDYKDETRLIDQILGIYAET